jgi:proline-specific peptidase
MTSNSVSFRLGSETFQTSYTIFGDLNSGTRPLVVLNGGPGISHNYMLPHANLHKTHGRPVILYDQLGSGASTCLRDKPAGFFTPALFVAELHNLIQHLRIGSDFDLLGQSWGVTLAIEYIAAHHPQGLKHLILTSGTASYPLWRAALADLRGRWPRDYQDIMDRHEREGTIDAQEYQEGLMRFYRKHILNLEVWPEEATKSMMQMGEDPTVYRAMYVRAQLPLAVNSPLRTIAQAWCQRVRYDRHAQGLVRRPQTRQRILPDADHQWRR